MGPTRLIALVALCGVALVARPARAQFGREEVPAGYNLGPLGARAEVVPKNQRPTYKLSTGQSALTVVSVVDGQPGQLAGLAAGDVILGTAAGIFTDKLDPVYQLAAAIEPLFARPKVGTLALSVWRGGKVIPLSVSLGGHGPKWADTLADASLTYLVGQQDSDGSFPSAMISNNAKVAVTALSGLALIAAEGIRGPRASAIALAKDYLLTAAGVENERAGGGLGGAGNWSQVNWSLGYGTLFLAEYAAQTQDPAVLARLAELCQQIAKNQETNGGWAHGPGGPNALGYTDFAAVTNVVLAGYGAAGKVKVALAPTVIAKATSYLVATASGDGGIGYSQRDGQRGMGDPGRTAATMFAFAMTGQTGNPFFGRMASYFKRHLAEVPEGHASPVYHFGFGALGAYEAGLERDFLAVFRPELLMARNADGSFAPRPSQEQKMMRSSSDGSMGACWTTGSYLLVWNLGRGHLSLFAKKPKR